MNRSVLLVTPYFAPQTHAAMFRVFKLAKYLPRYGWKPYVLTTDTNYLYNEDPSLLDELPPEVEITRARYIEPTLRGLRMALGGEDRTFAALKARAGTAIDASPVAPCSGTPGNAERLYRHVRERWLESPDGYWTWYGPALRAARRLVAAHRIPLVYTTCVPYTCPRIGRALQRDGLKWIADFRDPPTYLARTTSRMDQVYLRQRRIERDTLQHADVVTTLSSAYELIFRDMYGADVQAPVHFIPTGLDDDYLPDHPDTTRPYPYLAFAGEYLVEYGSTFLEAFARVLANERGKARDVRLVLAGRAEVNRRHVLPIAARLGIEHAIEFVDHLPQPQLYSLLQGALAAVLIPGPTAHWWNNFAKMVDYIALRIPCLAMVPDPSEARTALTKANTAIFLDGDLECITQKLTAFLSGSLPTPTPNATACDRYLASTQVEAFAHVMERLVEW